MNESVLLQANDLVAGYTERNVLRGVTIALSAGIFTGVIGPNGSGKSTLIKALTGILPLREGRLLLENRPLKAYSSREIAQKVAVVPQPSIPVFAFTVREMVEMGRHPHLGRFSGFSEQDRAIVNEAIELTDISHLCTRTVDQLSAGELQRVTIARALAQQPKILLLDEPTAHLDIGHQMDIFELLVRLTTEQHLAVLCISHDLNLAAEYCKQVILFSEGRIYSEGDPTSVVTEANLRAVYGTLVRVQTSPYSGQPVVLVGRTSRTEDEQ